MPALRTAWWTAVAAMGTLALLTAIDRNSGWMFQEPTVHVVLIALAILVTSTLGAISLRIFVLSGSVRSLSLAAALILFASVYVWHGVFTKDGHPFAFLIYGPSSRLVFGLAFLAFASATVVESRHRFPLLFGLMGGAGLVAVIGYFLHDPLSDWAMGKTVDTFLPIRLTVEAFALVAVFLGLVRFIRAHSQLESRANAWIVASVTLLMAQSVYFMATNAWTGTWWMAHALGSASTLMLTVSVVADAQSVERREEQRRFHELNTLKTEFINTAAHELRTPLTPIRVQLRVLQKRVGHLPEAEKSVELLDRNVQRLEVLVDRILDGAKSMAGRLQAAFEPFDLSATVRAIHASYEPRFAEHGIAFTLEAPDTFEILSDEHRVQQVVNNLVENALKYTPDNGAVRIEVAAGDVAVVSVTDSGIGLNPALHDSLFEPFAQGTESLRAKGGSGLGLFLSRQIMDRLGGTIEASSPGEGQGATFRIEIPLQPPIDE